MTKLNSYKVEISEVQKYIFDIQAESEEKAKELVEKEWNDNVNTGTVHLFEYGDREMDITEIYDVTDTDDDAFLTTN